MRKKTMPTLKTMISEWGAFGWYAQLHQAGIERFLELEVYRPLNPQEVSDLASALRRIREKMNDY